MSMTGQGRTTKLKAALLTLEKLKVPFRGPFITPKEKRIFLINGCIVTESEVVALYEGGHLNPENIGKVLNDLKLLQTTKRREGNPMSEQDAQNRRRSQRVMLQVAVLLRVEMAEGRTAQVQGFTLVVNAHGGLLESSLKLTCDQRITIINPQSGKMVGCRVVRVEKPSGGNHTIAFEFDQRSPQFWPVTFPPEDWGVTEEVASDSR